MRRQIDRRKYGRVFSYAMIGLLRLFIINIGAGNSISFLPKFFTKLMLPYFMKWFKAIIDDKNRMECAIMNSGLNWTIIRAVTIKNKPAIGKANATLDGRGLKFSIAHSDAAKFVVNQLADNTFAKQAPVLSN